MNILVDFALVTYDCLRITDRNDDSMYFKEEKSLGKIANDTFKISDRSKVFILFNMKTHREHHSPLV